MAGEINFPNWIQSVWMTSIRPDPYFKAPKVVDEAMLHHTGPKRLALQAGSHIGIWPAKLSDYFEQVVAFEPVLENYLASIHNITSKNVLLIPACLSSDVGFVCVSNSSGFGGSASIVGIGEGPLSVSISVSQLPEWILSRVDAIFLDVEGYELEILRGATDILEENHPTVVIEENNKSLQIRKRGEAASFLSSFGYSQVATHFDDLIFTADRS